MILVFERMQRTIFPTERCVEVSCQLCHKLWFHCKAITKQFLLSILFLFPLASIMYSTTTKLYFYRHSSRFWRKRYFDCTRILSRSVWAIVPSKICVARFCGAEPATSEQMRDTRIVAHMLKQPLKSWLLTISFWTKVVLDRWDPTLSTWCSYMRAQVSYKYFLRINTNRQNSTDMSNRVR